MSEFEDGTYNVFPAQLTQWLVSGKWYVRFSRLYRGNEYFHYAGGFSSEAEAKKFKVTNPRIERITDVFLYR